MSNSTNHSSWIEKAPLLKPPFSYVSFAEFAKLSQVDTNANYSSTMDGYILTNSKTNPNKSHRGLAVTALNKFKQRNNAASAFCGEYKNYWNKRYIAYEEKAKEEMRIKRIEATMKINNATVDDMVRVHQESITSTIAEVENLQEELNPEQSSSFSSAISFPPEMPRLPTPDVELSGMMPPSIMSHVVSPICIKDFGHKTVTTSNYVYNNYDYTEKFTSFKRESAKKLKRDRIFYFEDNFNELLSLSHVLWLEPAQFSPSLVAILGKKEIQDLYKQMKNKIVDEVEMSPLTTKIIKVLQNQEPNETDEIDAELSNLEVEARQNKDQAGIHLLKVIRSCVDNLPPYKMKNQIMEHELKETYINTILNPFFSVKEEFKFRSPEENIPERLHRTDFIKKPDAIVSAVDLNEFSYTKLVGEVKCDIYSFDSLDVQYDMYKLAIYGKDCVDEGTENVILYQAVGLEVRFYCMALIEDAFYAVVFLLSISLPSAVDNIARFIHGIENLYKIRDILRNKCTKNQNNIHKEWRRDTMETPIFEDMIETTTNKRPARKTNKRDRDGNFTPQ